MITFNCPQCGKHYKQNDDAAGKRAKCSCGTKIVIPQSVPPTLRPPDPDRVPMQNQIPDQRDRGVADMTDQFEDPFAESKVTPEQKLRLSIQQALADGVITAEEKVDLRGLHKDLGIPGEVASQIFKEETDSFNRRRADNTPDIQAGDNSVITAESNKSSSVKTNGDAHSIPSAAITGQPTISTGENSVVKADINASQNIDASQSVSVHGDVVTHNEVHAQQTTNVYKESGVRGLLEGYINAVMPGAKEVRQIMSELEALTDDPHQLASVFSKYIHGIRRVPWYSGDPAAKRILPATVQICGAALQRLRLVAGDDPKWASRIAAFEAQFATAKENAKIK
jgi:hypothetical protein